MKKISSPKSLLINFVVLSFSVAFLISCSENDGSKEEIQKSPRIPKGIELISPISNQQFTLGDSISFELRHKEGLSIDSIKFTLFSEETVVAGGKYVWKSSVTGSPEIRVSAYYDGKNESIYPKIKILADQPPKQFSYKVVNEYPHDPTAYTQGLYFLGDKLVESTGQRGSSTIRITDYKSGEIEKIKNLESRYFGEGATVFKNSIYQLTWTGQTAFVYDLDLNQTGSFRYSTEGWGLTTYGEVFLMTDGTNKLRFINPSDFSIMKTLEVYNDEDEVSNLNEIEVINGICYANVYADDYIVGIDLNSGAVVERIEFKNLIDRSRYVGPDYALNGIAYHAEEERIFVTGKLWPSLFEVEFIENPL